MPQESKHQFHYRRPTAEEVFTDREEPFSIFEAARNSIPPDKPKLLIFYGVGGLGKSALCDALIRHIEQEKGLETTYGLLRIDPLNNQQPHEALFDLRFSIEKHSRIPFHAFDYAFTLYWELMYPELKLHDYRRGRISHLNESLPDFAKEAAELARELGDAATHSAAVGLSIRAFRWLNKKRHENWAKNNFPLLRELFDDDGQLIHPNEIVNRLPLLLVADMKDHQKSHPDHKILIFIDEYEQLWTNLALKAGEAIHPVDEAIKELVANCPGALFVLFSREQLHWGHDDSGWIEDLQGAQHCLVDLSTADADVFLRKCGVTELPLRLAIIESAGGDGPGGCHPELLDLAVDHYLLQKLGRGYIPQPDDFQTGSVGLTDRRRKLVHRFLRGCNDRSFRDTVRYLAAAESFDRALFEELVRSKTLFPATGFYHLISYSFVQQLEEGRFQLHPRMREVLLDDLQPDEYRAVHDFYFRYYDELCRPDSPANITRDHEKALSAAAQHLLVLDEFRFAEWLDEVSEVFCDGARYNLLRPLLERELAILEKALRPDLPRVALSLRKLAVLLRDTNHLSNAEVLIRRALEIDENMFGPCHSTVASDLRLLAALLRDTDRLGEAELLLRRLLKMEEDFGPNQPNTALALRGLAALLRATNRLGEAELLLRRALEIHETNFGADHPDIALDLNNLAILLQETNRLAEAERLMRRALEIDENRFGPHHPNVARDLHHLVIFLQYTTRLDEAEPLMRRALEIDENTFGSDHPSVAHDLNNLAMLLKLTNRANEASPLMARALEIDENSFGPDHSNVARDLNNLAALVDGTDRFHEAEPLLRRALQINENIFGPAHPIIARTLNNLAALLKDTNRLKEAEALLRRALEIEESTLRPDHPDLAICLKNLALVLKEANRLAEAEPLMQRAAENLSEFTRVTGHPHPSLNDVVGNYTSLLQMMSYTQAQIQTKLQSLAPATLSDQEHNMI